MSRLFNLEASPFFPKSVLDLYQRKRFELMPLLLHNQKNIFGIYYLIISYINLNKLSMSKSLRAILTGRSRTEPSYPG